MRSTSTGTSCPSPISRRWQHTPTTSLPPRTRAAPDAPARTFLGRRRVADRVTAAAERRSTGPEHRDRLPQKRAALNSAAGLSPQAKVDSRRSVTPYRNPRTDESGQDSCVGGRACRFRRSRCFSLSELTDGNQPVEWSAGEPGHCETAAAEVVRRRTCEPAWALVEGGWHGRYFVKHSITQGSCVSAESCTPLSLYLRFMEEFEDQESRQVTPESWRPGRQTSGRCGRTSPSRPLGKRGLGTVTGAGNGYARLG